MADAANEQRLRAIAATGGVISAAWVVHSALRIAWPGPGERFPHVVLLGASALGCLELGLRALGKGIGRKRSDTWSAWFVFSWVLMLKVLSTGSAMVWASSFPFGAAMIAGYLVERRRRAS